AAALPSCSTCAPLTSASSSAATGSIAISPARGTMRSIGTWWRESEYTAALPSPRSRAHIRHMAKTPGKAGAPKKPGRDPAKHSKKDPAKPTRAKAARPELPPIAPALADLLNPAIGRGEAGPGSQTGLKPPPDNSWDRRQDFSAEHRARKSTQQSFNEAPQAQYSAKGTLTAKDLGP